MTKNIQITYTFKYNVDSRKCESLVESLEPDNSRLPYGIYIENTCKDDSMIIKVTCDSCNILSFKNTIIDLLLNLKIGIESLRSLDILEETKNSRLGF